MKKIRSQWQCRKILTERGIRCAGDGHYNCRIHTRQRDHQATRDSIEMSDLMMIVVAEQSRNLPPDKRLKLLQDARLKANATTVVCMTERKAQPAAKPTNEEQPMASLTVEASATDQQPAMQRMTYYVEQFAPAISVEEQLAKFAESCAAKGIVMPKLDAREVVASCLTVATATKKSPKKVQQGPPEDPQHHLERVLAKTPEDRRELVRDLFARHPDLSEVSRRVDRDLKIMFCQKDDGTWYIDRVRLTSR